MSFLGGFALGAICGIVGVALLNDMARRDAQHDHAMDDTLARWRRESAELDQMRGKGL